MYDKFSVHTLCSTLYVDRGTFYNHMFRNKKADTSYKARKEKITQLVIDIFHQSNQVYGASKICGVLLSIGTNTTAKYVKEIMNKENLVSIRLNSKQYHKFLNNNGSIINVGVVIER